MQTIAKFSNNDFCNHLSMLQSCVDYNILLFNLIVQLLSNLCIFISFIQFIFKTISTLISACGLLSAVIKLTKSGKTCRVNFLKQ